LRRVVIEACRAEHTLGLADAYQTNAAALTEILGRHPVSLEAFPRSIMEAAYMASGELLTNIASTSPLAGRIVASYRSAQHDLRGWSALAADMARATTRASSATR
jgi:TRAP-type mannitol/chloroaromatic compound transport system substrate-binding protein